MPASAVPSNSLQRRIHELHNSSVGASPWAKQVTLGLILRVWDRHTQDEGLPLQVVERLQNAPGAIICEVAYRSGGTGFHSLSISEDERFMLYGNALALKGRPVEIEYYSGNILNGKLKLAMDGLNKPIREQDSTEIYDIGSI